MSTRLLRVRRTASLRRLRRQLADAVRQLDGNRVHALGSTQPLAPALVQFLLVGLHFVFAEEDNQLREDLLWAADVLTGLTRTTGWPSIASKLFRRMTTFRRLCCPSWTNA